MRAAAAILFLGATVAGQQPPSAPATPGFEAVSIKRNVSGANAGGQRAVPGGYAAVNVPFHLLIGLAYPVQGSELVGAPDWFYDDPYDVTVRIAGTPTPEQSQSMWRALFAERMKLRAHVEPREQAVYALVLARPDGRVSSNLKKVDTDCAAPDATAQCTRLARGILTTQGISMAALARLIQPTTGRIVVDRTGLTGNYALTLTFSPTRPNAPVDPGRAGDELPSIFTALPEQLGLKLEPTRSPVNVLVIEHIERPAED